MTLHDNTQHIDTNHTDDTNTTQDQGADTLETSNNNPRAARMALGWRGHFSAQEAEVPDGALTGRVLSDRGAQLEVWTPEGTVWARVNGRMRHAATSRIDLPAAGDWVGVVTHGDGTGTVVHLMERASAMIRQAAGDRTEPQVIGANLDTIFIVTSANQEFNTRRLERYLTAVRASGAEPVVVLSKADLARDLDRLHERAERVAGDAPVLITSALDGEGVEALLEHMGEGRTVALVGSSGVGKSTLVNWLMGREVQATRQIRADDDEGRHTTTHRQLFVLPDRRGVLLDTPGMRELQLWGEAADVDSAFADIAALAEECRFRDCTHQHEPGCAVVAAVESGALPAGRLRNFDELQREAAYQLRRVDEQAARAERARWKRITKSYRAHTRKNPRG